MNGEKITAQIKMIFSAHLAYFRLGKNSNFMLKIYVSQS